MSYIARYWYLLVGIRWQRLQCRIAAHYFQRVTYPARVWQAFGCPSRYTPRLPWWHHLVFVWLRCTGWRSR